MIPRFARLWLAACAVAVVSLQAQIPGRPAPLPVKNGDEMIQSFKLSDGDIDSVLGALETYTGRTVLRPQALPTNTYSLRITRPIPKSELVMALETLLALNQVGVTPLGDKFLKIVPLAQAKSEAPEYIEGSTLGLPPSGRIATKLFQLNFLRANEFFNGQLNGIFSPGIGNGVVVLEKANAALITDSISNLQRIETLLDRLDKPSTGGLTTKFYPLANAKASDVVQKLRTMLTGPIASQIGSATTFSADDRTNQVILVADPGEQPFFDKVIANLDIVDNPNTRNEVIYLKHADAKDVATLLSQLVSGQNSASQKSSGSTAPRPGDINSVAGRTPEGAQAAQGAQGQSLLAGLAAGSNEFSSLVTILPDERSNSVVVSGTPGDIRLIKELVDKIDIVLAQVRIECVIAEVTLSDTDVSGIQALNLTVGQNAKGGTSITNFSGSEMTGWAVTSGVVNPLAFVAAFGGTGSNPGSKSLTKVLSAPVIVTTHNKQAEIQVGESLPVITSTFSEPISGATTAANSLGTNSTVSYQNIVIDLKVTPLIGDDGNVQMTVDQKVQDIVSYTSINGNQQPIIGIREANSFVSCQDGQMIVLGGLQRTEKDTTQTKLGFLYEIPIISQLLGGHTDTFSRTELLFFLRPHVVPLSASTWETHHEINSLGNKDMINSYLQNPGQQTKENNNKTQNFLDRFKH